MLRISCVVKAAACWLLISASPHQAVDIPDGLANPTSASIYGNPQKDNLIPVRCSHLVTAVVSLPCD